METKEIIEIANDCCNNDKMATAILIGLNLIANEMAKANAIHERIAKIQEEQARVTAGMAAKTIGMMDKMQQDNDEGESWRNGEDN